MTREDYLTHWAEILCWIGESLKRSRDIKGYKIESDIKEHFDDKLKDINAIRNYLQLELNDILEALDEDVTQS